MKFATPTPKVRFKVYATFPASVTDEVSAARQDHAYAVGFQAGVILATTEEQSRVHSHAGVKIDNYSEDYKSTLAAVERQRAEALKVLKQADRKQVGD